jgi:hypothetical protein
MENRINVITFQSMTLQTSPFQELEAQSINTFILRLQNCQTNVTCRRKAMKYEFH